MFSHCKNFQSTFQFLCLYICISLCVCVCVLRCVLGRYAQVGGTGGAGRAEEDGTAAGRSGPDDGGVYMCVCVHLCTGLCTYVWFHGSNLLCIV